MDTKSNDVGRARLKFGGLTWLMYTLASLLVIYFVSIGLAPAFKKATLRKLVLADTLFTASYDSLYSHPSLDSLLKEKAYKNALLELSGNDSIHLVVNLRSSLACLYIKGVNIHHVKVQPVSTDKLLATLPAMQYYWLFSKPLSVKRQHATIVKEPIVERHAPKDTVEAAQNAYQPDTLIQNPAFLQLSTEQGIQIIFEQQSNPAFRDQWIPSWESLTPAKRMGRPEELTAALVYLAGDGASYTTGADIVIDGAYTCV
ncbi:MAG: SDR family oxidoreductase [Bacteroidales bacterium]|nr:SDR family oxidoreductase [Bacteroidales bacterium]